MKILITPSNISSIDIELQDKTNDADGGYIAKDIASAILVITCILKGINPPKFYNKCKK